MEQIFSSLENLGLVQILIWLLSFAIVYGILDQMKIPKNKGPRTIISLVIAFMVLFAAPIKSVEIISKMSTGLLLFLLAVIIFMIFIETAGVKKLKKHEDLSRKAKTTIHESKEAHNIFEEYSKYFAIAFFLIALLIFIGAGGLDLIGFNINLGSTSIMSLGFLIIIILAIMWMIANPD